MALNLNELGSTKEDEMGMRAPTDRAPGFLNELVSSRKDETPATRKTGIALEQSATT